MSGPGNFQLGDRRCMLPPDIEWDEAETCVDDVGAPVASQSCQPPPQPRIQDIYVDPYDINVPPRQPFSSPDESCCSKMSSCLASCCKAEQKVIYEPPSRSGSGYSEISIWDTDAKPGKYGRLPAHIDMNEAKVVAVPPQKAKKGCCNIL